MMESSEYDVRFGYQLPLEPEQACRLLAAWVNCRGPEIRLVHQEQQADQTVLTLYHKQWGAIGAILLTSDGISRTVITFSEPPAPLPEESGIFREQLLAGPPAEAGMLRLELIEKSVTEADEFICRCVQRERRAYLHRLDLLLCNSFPIEPLPERDIPIGAAQVKSMPGSLTPGDARLLEMWADGCTARQIAKRTDRSEKTVLNRLSWLRKAHGEQVVPRRKTG
jgi:DNA-binding CsgD family transcriptional regulator